MRPPFDRVLSRQVFFSFTVDEDAPDAGRMSDKELLDYLVIWARPRRETTH